MDIEFAPMQGYTDAVYRHEHHRLFPGIKRYYTPFIRVEKGEARKRDIAHLKSSYNADVPLVPQVIASGAEEFRILRDAVTDAGYKCIDLNIGCPFPMQTSRGRGTAMMDNPQALSEIAEVMKETPEIQFSLKMRAGNKDISDWRNIIEIINDMPLVCVTMHPRIARQKYDGPLDMEAFGAFLAGCKYPVVFNGELKSPEDIREIAEKYPTVAGVMIGRGLLAIPSLAMEYENGETWSESRRLEALMELNERVTAVYEETLCGDAQILSKARCLWDYAEPLIGHRAFKMIHKARTMAAFHEAVLNVK